MLSGFGSQVKSLGCLKRSIDVVFAGRRATDKRLAVATLGKSSEA